VGIVAGRLRERWRKPVVVIGLDPAADIGKGSGRSQPGVNLGRAVQAAFEEGLLLAGGGHAMAAGLTIRPREVPELRAFLTARLAEEWSEAVQSDALEIDAALTPAGADRALLQTFDRLAPFGPGNPEPVFAFADLRVAEAMPMKGGHVRATLVSADGAKLRAVAWRAGESPLGAKLLARDSGLHAAGRLKPDDWNGRNGVQLEIEDLADPRLAA
jgi:single-stranded-DNA-specific exonuclease